VPKNEQGRPTHITAPQPTSVTAITHLLRWVLSTWSRTLRVCLLILVLVVTLLAFSAIMPIKLTSAGLGVVGIRWLAQRRRRAE
jgi:hypothetical protein